MEWQRESDFKGEHYERRPQQGWEIHEGCCEMACSCASSWNCNLLVCEIIQMFMTQIFPGTYLFQKYFFLNKTYKTGNKLLSKLHLSSLLQELLEKNIMSFYFYLIAIQGMAQC